MKKFINNPNNVTNEMLEGLAFANKAIISLYPGNLVVNNRLATSNRVTVVTQSASGSEPSLCGFVGQGMVDISVVGDVFATPGPEPCLDALRRANHGPGVLYVALNHPSDIFTAKLAYHAACEEALPIKPMIIQDDIAMGPGGTRGGSRGYIGSFPTLKIAGAAAAEGMSLENVALVAQRLNQNTATLGVAVSGGTHPQNDSILAEIDAGNMALGMGPHGEIGNKIFPMKSANETAELVLTPLLEHLKIEAGESVLLLVNGSGATTLMELLVVYRWCDYYLRERKIQIVANHVGSLFTVPEQSGFHLCLARMDDELLRLWKAPCNTPYFKC